MFMLAQRRRPAQADDPSRRFWLDADAETALHPQINDYLPAANGYVGRGWFVNGDHRLPALMDCYNQASPGSLAWPAEGDLWRRDSR